MERLLGFDGDAERICRLFGRVTVFQRGDSEELVELTRSSPDQGSDSGGRHCYYLDGQTPFVTSEKFSTSICCSEQR